jgi:hypothetical protein
MPRAPPTSGYAPAALDLLLRQVTSASVSLNTMRDSVEVVIPVYNEERILASSIRRLLEYLRRGFPSPFVLTIVDNGSTDGTFAIARQLATGLADVRAVHLDLKGRGRALRYAWENSDADVVAALPPRRARPSSSTAAVSGRPPTTRPAAPHPSQAPRPFTITSKATDDVALYAYVRVAICPICPTSDITSSVALRA